MTLSEDRIVLAVECKVCQQLTAIPTYDGVLHIARCGSCGRRFDAAERLVSQYQISAARIATYEMLHQALQEARHAMMLAFTHWGRKAGKAVLAQALSSADAGTGTEAREVQI